MDWYFFKVYESNKLMILTRTELFFILNKKSGKGRCKIMINSILNGFEEEIGKDVKVIVEDRVNGKCVDKVYQKNADGTFELIEIIDDAGVHELTAIPNFSQYMADLERGKVFSIKANRWLNPKPNKRFGYVYSTLINDQKKSTAISIHQVMMSAHKQVKPKSWMRFRLEIDHVNGVKHDNSIDNLRLIRHTEQFCDVVRKKMSESNAKRLSKNDVRYLRLVKEVLQVKANISKTISVIIIVKSLRELIRQLKKS